MSWMLHNTLKSSRFCKYVEYDSGPSLKSEYFMWNAGTQHQVYTQPNTLSIWIQVLYHTVCKYLEKIHTKNSIVTYEHHITLAPLFNEQFYGIGQETA
jgi:hypothetical protein